MTSIFEGTQPLKSRPKFQAKQGAPFEVLGTYNYILVLVLYWHTLHVQRQFFLK